MWLQKHDPDRESAVKEAMELQVERLHVMAVLQGIKKLFGPLLDDLDCVSAVKEAMELQVEACMKEEDDVTAASSRDLSVEENPEVDWFGTITRHLSQN